MYLQLLGCMPSKTESESLVTTHPSTDGEMECMHPKSAFLSEVCLLITLSRIYVLKSASLKDPSMMSYTTCFTFLTNQTIFLEFSEYFCFGIAEYLFPL